MRYKKISDIKGFEFLNNYYFVNELGEIYKFDKKENIVFIKPYKVSNKKEQPFQVKLYGKINNKTVCKNLFVHRIVKLAFDYVENCENLVVHHKDKNKNNNNLYNLEWLTSEIHTSLHNVERDIENKMLTEREVCVIKKLNELGWTNFSIGELFEINRSIVSDIISCKTYCNYLANNC